MSNTDDRSTENAQLNIPSFLLTPTPNRVPTSAELDDRPSATRRRSPSRKKTSNTRKAHKASPRSRQPLEYETITVAAIEPEPETEPIAKEPVPKADAPEAEVSEAEAETKIEPVADDAEASVEADAPGEDATEDIAEGDASAEDASVLVEEPSDESEAEAEPTEAPDDSATGDPVQRTDNDEAALEATDAEPKAEPEAEPTPEEEIDAMMKSVMLAVQEPQPSSIEDAENPVAEAQTAQDSSTPEAEPPRDDAAPVEPSIDEPLDEATSPSRPAFQVPSLAQLGITLPKIEPEAESVADASAAEENAGIPSMEAMESRPSSTSRQDQSPQQSDATPEPEPEPPSIEEDLQSLKKLERHLFANRYASLELETFGSTIDPNAAVDDRTEALSILAEERNELLSKPEIGAVIDRLSAQKDKLDPTTSAQVKVLARDRHRLVSVPASMQARLVRLASDAREAWKRARTENDWRIFAPYLDRLVAFKQKIAHEIDSNSDPYDIMLDEFESGTNRDFYDKFFEKTKNAVLPLLDAISASGRTLSRACVEGRFDERRQWDLAFDICDLMDIREDAHYLTSTIHPFSEGMSSNYVVTALHINGQDVMSGVYGALHELGHGLYEQGVDPALNRTSLKGGTSYGMHEAQARFFENYVGRDRAFVGPLLQIMRNRFPGQLGRVTPNQLHRAANAVMPSPIRVDADEVTYPLHVIIRYEIEKMLFDGTVTAREVPKLWADRYESYLGVRPNSHVEGALQDIHWAMGEFGYFPTYALGTAYAAQLRAKMVEDGIDWQNTLRSGDLRPIKEWLGTHVWRYGRTLDSAEIINNACGEPFDAGYYTDYLTNKYSDLYNLRWN